MPTSRAMKRLQKELTDNALDIAKDAGVTLDFSHQSINHVERMLGECHREFKRTKDEEGLHGIALSFSAYIVTVIERHFEPGTWKKHDPDWGKHSFPYHWRDGTTFIYGWCLKRILDGPGDNVWSKYQAIVLSQQSRKASKGPTKR